MPKLNAWQIITLLVLGQPVIVLVLAVLLSLVLLIVVCALALSPVLLTIWWLNKRRYASVKRKLVAESKARLQDEKVKQRIDYTSPVSIREQVAKIREHLNK